MIRRCRACGRRFESWKLSVCPRCAVPSLKAKQVKASVRKQPSVEARYQQALRDIQARRRAA